jgi:hypothetical protein
MLDWPSLKALTNTIQEEEEEEGAGEEKEKGKVGRSIQFPPSFPPFLLSLRLAILSRPLGTSRTNGSGHSPPSLPPSPPSLPFLPQALEALLDGHPLLGRALTCDTTLASLVSSLRETLYVRYGEKE